jgi:hypothetical protein
LTTEEEKDENARQKILNQTREQYRRLYRVIQIQPDDNILIILGKILLTILGVALMILFSPLIIFILIFAFLAAF